TSDVPQLIEVTSILPSGFDGELRLLDVGIGCSDVNTESTTTTSMMAALLNQSAEVISLKCPIEEIQSQAHAELASIQAMMRSQFERLSSSIKRIALQPVVRATTSNSNNDLPLERSGMYTRLSKRPRDLYELWKEYEFGIGGGKPAKSFNEKERGASKFMYSFRLNYWRLIDDMIKRGYTSDTAIDAIYAKYGRSKSATCVLTQLRKCKQKPNEF
ncbi:hypothetical protein AC1031_021663, partial [Aphanomyces cochlioides]